MMHVSVNIVTLLFILLVTLLCLIGRGGIVVTSLLRNCNIALLILLLLYEVHVLAVTQCFFSVESCVSTIVALVTSSCYLASWNYHLLTSLILTAIHAIKHFPFLNCFIVGGDAGLLEWLIGYNGSDFSTSATFEHGLANADSFLLERVLWPSCYRHVRVLIFHLNGIILRLITSEIRLSVCKLLIAIHIRILIIQLLKLTIIRKGNVILRIVVFTGQLAGCSNGVWLYALSLTADKLAILVLLGTVTRILILILLDLVIIKYLKVFVVSSSFLLGCICLSGNWHWILKFTLAVSGVVLLCRSGLKRRLCYVICRCWLQS